MTAEGGVSRAMRWVLLALVAAMLPTCTAQAPEEEPWHVVDESVIDGIVTKIRSSEVQVAGNTHPWAPDAEMTVVCVDSAVVVTLAVYEVGYGYSSRRAREGSGEEVTRLRVRLDDGPVLYPEFRFRHRRGFDTYEVVLLNRGAALFLDQMAESNRLAVELYAGDNILPKGFVFSLDRFAELYARMDCA